MNSTTGEEIIQEADVPMEGDVLSVYRAFEQVQDGRPKRGVRARRVAVILTLIVLAKLAGMTTPGAIAEWVRLRAGWLRKGVPGTRESFPGAATSSNVLQALDAEQVNEVVTQLVTRGRAMKRCGDEPSRLLGQVEREEHGHGALDGKTLRGTRSPEAADQRKMHQLALSETGTGLVLKEQVVGDKENELSIVSQFLSPGWVKGRIISADALHTPRLFCAEVTHAGGYFLLVAKGNQSTLRDDLQLFFSEPPVDCRDWRTARTVDKEHGRLEIRHLEASSELNEFLADKWTGVAQVFRLVRTVTKKGQTSEEVLYGLTALSPAQASAQQVLAFVREHWPIENRLHWRRDVTLCEDDCQGRKGAAPRVLAVLDFIGVSNGPSQMRTFGAYPWQAVRLLLGSLLTFTDLGTSS
jgi:predicted transposase YbfD/YdcC